MGIRPVADRQIGGGVVNTFSPLDIRMSLFAGALGVEPIGEPTLREILADIKSGKYKNIVERLRAQKAQGNEAAYEEGKKKLPGFTLSARLKTRSTKVPLPEKLIAHTHLLQIDIDEVPAPGIEFFEAKLRNDPVVLFCFRSPSGQALKVGIRIDGTRHNDSYLSAEKYFLEKYQVKIDPKVKEVPRLCFVSYDPHPHINEKAEILPVAQNGFRPPIPSQSTDPTPTSPRKLTHGERALETARKMIDRSIEGEKLNELLKASKLLGGYVSGRMLARVDAEACLRSAIECKAGVNNLNTAYKAIVTGLDYGEQAPFDFEDLERERLQYQKNTTRVTTVTTVTEGTKGDRGLQKATEGDKRATEATELFEANIRGAVRGYVEESPGKFSTSDIDRELGLTSRVQKQNRSKCLSVLVCEGLIERDLNRRGVFRKKDNALTEMDITGARSKELPIELPFGLSKFVEINEKEIILVMGESNSGKTAVIFNMIWSNLKTLLSEGWLRAKNEPVKELSPPTTPHINNTKPIFKSKEHTNSLFGMRYFSSEMGPTGVRKKLEAFGEDYPLSQWIEYVCSVERNHDFQDVIDPNGLNFIDYLEVFDGEYFKLSSNITSIFAALQTGIAVIALQKKIGTDIGRGGEATLEKPRLAIALSENKDKGYSTAKIVKAKHYRDRNPVGMELDFIVRRKGTQIIQVSQWGYAKDHQVRRNCTNYHEYDVE